VAAEPRRRAAARVALCGLLLLAVPAAEAAAEECVDCHDAREVGSGETSVHPPFAERDCGACHADHGERERLELVEEGDALCAPCHEAGGEPLLAAHQGVRPGDGASCTGCHDPHRSAERRLLRPARHQPVREGSCRSCHRSDGRVLISVQSGLCHLCHPKGPFTQAVVHPPVRAARCLECHDPHGSSSRALLLGGDYTPEREATGGERGWSFCLRCHDGGPFRGEPGAATRFADRVRGNLHLLHVRPPAGNTERVASVSGLSCRNCHEVHSAPRPALTRTELECGPTLCLKLEFVPSAEGGSCLASCHGERVRYVRP